MTPAPTIIDHVLLVNEVRHVADVPRVRSSEVTRIIEAFCHVVRQKVVAGEAVTLPGLGRIDKGTLMANGAVELA